MVNMKNMIKKTAAITLSAVMAATLLPMQVYAEITVPVLVPPDDPNIEEAINTDVPDEAALCVTADGDNEVSVTAKDITNTSETGTGLYSKNEDNASIDIKVNGDIKGGSIGLEASGTSSGTNTIVVDGNVNGENGNGVWAHAGGLESKGGDVDVTVIGDVSGDTGVSSSSESKGNTVRVSVIGNVEGTGVSDNSHGVWSYACDNGQSEVYVSGNVSDHSPNGFGVCPIVYNGGKSWVIVKGDVTADGAGSAGLDIACDGEGSAENVVRVGGNVTGEEAGVRVSSIENNGNGVNVVIVEGTVSGGKSGIAVDEDQTGCNEITVWKIEKNAEGAVASTVTQDRGNLVYTENTELEKQIRYIIRVENPGSNARLNATDENGNALAHIDGIDGNRLEYATEGEKVLLKIDVRDGYSLDGVYGDEGRSLELSKDENGDYYILVPRGGGVVLSVKVSRKTRGDSSDRELTPASRAAVYYPAPVVTTSDFSAIMMINDAPENGEVYLAGMNNGALSALVTGAILSRPDLTYVITYYIGSILYRITIPAGTDITPLLNASGGIDFDTLAVAFNAVRIN